MDISLIEKNSCLNEFLALYVACCHSHKGLLTVLRGYKSIAQGKLEKILGYMKKPVILTDNIHKVHTIYEKDESYFICVLSAIRKNYDKMAKGEYNYYILSLLFFDMDYMQLKQVETTTGVYLIEFLQKLKK